MSLNGELREEVGWQELTGKVGKIYAALPANQRARAAILTANYGEAGAIDLYGAAYGLPQVISGVNSYWLRGYGDPPPQILIVLGMSQRYAEQSFESCTLAVHTSNRFGILNEETRDHPDIFVCQKPRQPWPAFWKMLQSFG